MAVDIGWATTGRRFRAMGTDCQVVVVGPEGDRHIAAAEVLVRRLEALWTRFDPASEVSRLGRADGQAVTVTAETFSLIEKAVLAWQLTDGRFDPTMAHQIGDLGYDRSFERIDRAEVKGATPLSLASVGCADIELNRKQRTVRLPAGVGFDPGGIGKGLAADITSKALIDNGAWGVLVNLGGDLRVRGTPPTGDTWVVAISEPTVAEEPLATVALTDGGVATSTTRKRRWNTGGVEHHHLLDPATGKPVHTGVDLVSTIAGDAWWAEATATALFGSDQQPVVPPGCAALRVRSDGTSERLACFEGYER